jgi:hypothetical protein
MAKTFKPNVPLSDDHYRELGKISAETAYGESLLAFCLAVVLQVRLDEVLIIAERKGFAGLISDYRLIVKRYVDEAAYNEVNGILGRLAAANTKRNGLIHNYPQVDEVTGALKTRNVNRDRHRSFALETSDWTVTDLAAIATEIASACHDLKDFLTRNTVPADSFPSLRKHAQQLRPE